MRLPANRIGHAVDVVETGIGPVVDRRQDDPLLHPLDGQGAFDGRRGAEGMADLGFVGGKGDLPQQLPEDGPQAVDLGQIALLRGGSMGVDVLDVRGLEAPRRRSPPGSPG